MMTEAILRLADVVKARRLRLATAESCTGGGIAAALTDLPGSSEWFVGGVVTYANEWKMHRLGVQEATLARFGAVSIETVHEMLEGLLGLGDCDLGIAVSGIAGPGGATPGKPVGTVYIGVAGRGWECIRRWQFGGDRAQVRRQTVETAIALMVEELSTRSSHE